MTLLHPKLPKTNLADNLVREWGGVGPVQIVDIIFSASELRAGGYQCKPLGGHNFNAKICLNFFGAASVPDIFHYATFIFHANFRIYLLSMMHGYNDHSLLLLSIIP